MIKGHTFYGRKVYGLTNRLQPGILSKDLYRLGIGRAFLPTAVTVAYKRFFKVRFRSFGSFFAYRWIKEKMMGNR